MSIKSFAPCSDWFFVFKDTKDEFVNYRLAGWAVFEGDNGETDTVIGMVPVHGGGGASDMPGACRLVAVPPVPGTYKHQSEIK